MPGAGPNALAAPQAALISALAKGVLGGDLNWAMIGYGALVGVGVVLADELLGRAGKLRLPPLGVGLGIYLPMAVTLPVVAGAVIGTVYEGWAQRQRDPEYAHRMGVLTATGMIVGDSLWGVLFAGIVYATASDAPLAVMGPEFETGGLFVGLTVFGALIAWLYRRTRRAVTG
jgi:putative OPT family oligopeptide transporter